MNTPENSADRRCPLCRTLLPKEQFNGMSRRVGECLLVSLDRTFGEAAAEYATTALHPIPLATILEVVAQRRSLKVEDLIGKVRSKEILLPRQLAIFLACELTGLASTQIGVAFGGRDHTSIFMARQTIKDRISAEPAFAAEVNGLITLIKATSEEREQSCGK